MKRKPAAIIVAKPMTLPVFNSHWKDKCLECANVLKFYQDGITILRCSASARVTRTIYKYCIDVYDQQCKTENLFTPSKRDV